MINSDFCIWMFLFFLDHDEDKFYRSLEEDVNGSKFWVVIDDDKLYWLMVI